jgi:hypothetical protein
MSARGRIVVIDIPLEKDDAGASIVFLLHSWRNGVESADFLLSRVIAARLFLLAAATMLCSAPRPPRTTIA